MTQQLRLSVVAYLHRLSARCRPSNNAGDVEQGPGSAFPDVDKIQSVVSCVENHATSSATISDTARTTRRCARANLRDCTARDRSKFRQVADGDFAACVKSSVTVAAIVPSALKAIAPSGFLAIKAERGDFSWENALRCGNERTRRTTSYTTSAMLQKKERVAATVGGDERAQARTPSVGATDRTIDASRVGSQSRHAKENHLCVSTQMRDS